MRIARYLTLLAATGLVAVACDKKDDVPATPPKTDSMPAADADKADKPMADRKPMPAKTDPEPVVDPADGPVVDPVPAAVEDAAEEVGEAAAELSAEHAAVFKKGLTVMDSLFIALEEAEDVDDAVTRLEALEPDFKEISEEMKKVGEPDEATAASFNAELAPLKEGYQERAEGAMMKLMGVDPEALASGTPPDPAVMANLQENGEKISGAVEKLMGYYQDAWKNVGDN